MLRTLPRTRIKAGGKGGMSATHNDPMKTAIWLTSRCRMIAEKRFRKYNYLSHILLSWLSLSVIVCAVVRGLGQPSVFLDTYAAVISVLVFAFSLIVFGFQFAEIAASHRECYLRLQKLHDCGANPGELANQYHEILSAYRNHGDWDFEGLVIERTLLQNRKLVGKSGEEITWSIPIVAKHALLGILFWALVASLFLLGLFPYVWAFGKLL